MIDPEILAELLAERAHERLAILEHGLVADFGECDAAGRVLLRFGAALRADDLVWLCGHGLPGEAQARVEEEGSRRWGVLTGLTRPCPVSRLN